MTTRHIHFHTHDLCHRGCKEYPQLTNKVTRQLWSSELWLQTGESWGMPGEPLKPAPGQRTHLLPCGWVPFLSLPLPRTYTPAPREVQLTASNTDNRTRDDPPQPPSVFRVACSASDEDYIMSPKQGAPVFTQTLGTPREALQCSCTLPRAARGREGWWAEKILTDS